MSIKLFVSTVEHDLLSGLIRWESKTAFSHAGWIRDDGSTFSAMLDGGVKWRPPNPAAKVLKLNAPGMESSFAWALTQEGAPYDWLNILGIALAHDWTLPGHTICDKFVLCAQRIVHYPLLNDVFVPYEHFNPGDILKSLLVSEAA